MKTNRPYNRMVVLVLAASFWLASTNSAAQTDPNLQRALAAMDTAAASFHSAQADFVWEQ
jgi:outer membrane lipoprotein-sorting protein